MSGWGSAARGAGPCSGLSGGREIRPRRQSRPCLNHSSFKPSRRPYDVALSSVPTSPEPNPDSASPPTPLMSLVRASRLPSRFARFSNYRPPPFRTYASAPPPRPRFFGARGLAIAGLSATTFVGLTLSTTAIYADAQAQVPVEGVLCTAPLSELVRAYVVYSLCSVPFLVDWSPTVLSVLTSIPGVKQITEAIIRITFFDQVRTRVYTLPHVSPL